ncbi:MAG: FAD-dependent oxidoreductase [Bacteroidota bacterium]
MNEVDYIVVGLGVAGISFCEQLRKHGKRFVVYDPGRETATNIAGGVVNPVVLKRFTPVWNVHQFLPLAYPFYKGIADTLETPCIEKTLLYRIFSNAEEQNNWMVASDSLRLAPYLSSEIIENTNTAIEAPFGFGSVKEVFRIDTPVMSKAYREALARDEILISESFEHDHLRDQGTFFQYKTYKAHKIVFAEGAGAVRNPFFRVDCLIPKKGEYIWVKAPQWRLKGILKGSVFVIPQGNDHYKVGATFDHHGKEATITQQGREQLESALRKIMNRPFEVVDQVVGMRPTVKDRRPLLGSLDHDRMFFYNGLGTRGLMMAPLLSKLLYEFAENRRPLANDIDIQRFAE